MKSYSPLNVILSALLAVCFSMTVLTPASANSDSPAWDKAPDLTNDPIALQRGARLFVNYCLTCHSAASMRYTRLKDLGLTENQIKDNLILSAAKIGETMKSTMSTNDAKLWFGTAPPDLSVIVRAKSEAGKGSGADYLYTYLRSYYKDASSPTGWNNLIFPSVAMPHVLWELQGEREPQWITSEHGGAKVFSQWKIKTPGSMTPAEFDQATAELVSFMRWMAEPGRNFREQIGIWVLFFLGILTFFTWRLNAAWWKEVK